MPGNGADLTLVWLAAGLVLGAAYVTCARRARAVRRTVYGVGLVVAALIYMLFLYRAADPLHWAVVEAAGVVGFGLAGILGARGSAWWLIAGWGLHPAWDVGLHILGPGHFVPAWYPVACVSFDLLVAGGILFDECRARSGTARGQP